MPSDWSWFDDFKKGDDHAFSKQLEAEADRSLARDPGRWSTKQVDETESHTPKQHGGGDSYTGGKRERGGGRGGARERGAWSKQDWENAKRDYEAQQHAYEQRLQRDQDHRSLRDRARDLRNQRRDPERDARREERRQAAADMRRENAARAREARDDYRQGRPPPGYKDW